MSTFVKRKRFFPLRHKSVITPPAHKVISKPLTKIITCSSNRVHDVDIKEVNDFVFISQEQRLKEKIPLHIFRDKKNIEAIVERLTNATMLKHNITIRIEDFHYDDGGSKVIFTFTEKQAIPGFREMKISRKSRFHPQNLCKTN